MGKIEFLTSLLSKKISINAYFFTKKLVRCLIFLKYVLVYQMMLIDHNECN